MEEQNLQKEILEEIKKLNRLTGIYVTKGLASGEKIVILAQAGLTPKEIAEILGVTPNLVSVTLFKSRHKGKGKTRGSSGKEKQNG